MWWFWLAVVPQSSNTTSFRATNKVEARTCAYCACSVHMLTHFTTLCLRWLRLRCLLNPCQSNIWWLTTARRNSYQPVLVRIYRNCAIVEAWLPFMTCRIWILRTLTCQAEVFCSWYMQIVESLQSLQARPMWLFVELFDEYPAPFFPEMMVIVIDHDTKIYYIQWHNIINGNRKKHQSLLLGGIGCGPGPSSPPSCFLSWHGN